MTEIKFYEYKEFSEWKVKNNYSEIFYDPEQKLLSSNCCTTSFIFEKCPITLTLGLFGLLTQQTMT